MLRKMFYRLRAHLRRGKVEREMDAELRFHLEMETEENLRRGMSEEETRLAARRSFGGVAKTKEAYRDVARFRWIEDLWQDVRYGVPMLRNTPAFTAVVVITLALGIGVNTALFSMLYLFYRPLPVNEVGTIVMLDSTEDMRMSFPEYVHLRKHTEVFSALSASFLRLVAAEDQNASETPQHVTAEFVSDNLFSFFEAKPALGRTFAPEETNLPGRDTAVVLSHGFWQTRFGGNPNVVGQTLRLNGIPFVVIGVTAPDFARFGLQGKAGFWKADLWLQRTMRGRLYPDTEGVTTGMEWYDKVDQRWLVLYRRLKPGRTTEEARAEMIFLIKQLNPEYSDFLANAKKVVPLTLLGTPTTMLASATVFMGVVLAATTMVLLIACANIATLLLARSTARRKEIGVRLCLGASRGRVIRQLLTESLLLAAIGGGAGLLLAWWCLQTFLAMTLVSALGSSDLERILLAQSPP